MRYKPDEFPVAPQPQTPALDVLFALGKYDAAVAELAAEAQRRPECRFPLDYANELPAGILLPHLAAMKGCAQGLNLRAIAALEAGQHEKAFSEVSLMFRLSDGIRHEPLLISHLVRVAINTIALQSIWEGLARHQWTDGELEKIQMHLARQDFLAEYQQAMRGERASSIGIIEYVRWHPREAFELFGNFIDLSGGISSTELVSSGTARLVPRSFYYFNQLNIARMLDQYFLPAINATNHMVAPDLQRRNSEALERELWSRFSPSKLFARVLLPALEKMSKKTAFAQSATDLALVGCALERYRLAQGSYPESLAALAPQFIAKFPHDVISGQPLHYRRTDDGQFLLYSVGWNEKDDGGTVVVKEYSKYDAVDIDKGDWVWRYPAK